MGNWTLPKGHFYPGSPAIEGRDVGSVERKERLRRKKVLENSRRREVLDMFIIWQDVDQNVACLKGVADMMSLVKGLKDVDLIYSRHHVSSLASEDISDNH